MNIYIYIRPWGAISHLFYISNGALAWVSNYILQKTVQCKYLPEL